MTATNLKPSFLATLAWEGGDHLSLVRTDPGNWTGGRIGVGKLVGTKWGVAAGSHPKLDIPALSEEEAAHIFAAEYWKPVNGDGLPIGLDHCVSDAAYNEGTRAALSFLVKASVTGESDPIQAIKDFSTARISYLKALRSWTTFGVGWGRRVGGVEAESLRMAMDAKGVPKPAQIAALAKHSATVRSTAKSHVAAAVITSAPASATTVLPHNGPFEVLLALLVLLAAALIGHSIINNARADGLEGKT